MDTKNYLKYFSILLFGLCLIQFTFAQKSAKDWFNKGIKASNPDDKIRYYQKSIELDSTIVEVYYNLAYVHKNNKEHDKALEALNKALNLVREETYEELKLSIFYELGVCYKRIENYSKSIEMFENAKPLARDKKIRTHILYELGRVALLANDFDKALAQFTEGSQISGNNKELFQTAIEMTQREKLLSSLYNEGITFLRQEEYDRAFETLSRVNKIDPNYKNTNIKLVEAQNQMRKKSDVASAKSVDELLKEGNAFFFAQNYNQALNKYKLVTEIGPFNSKVYYNMGQCYEKLENNEMAMAAYQKALLLKSNFKDARMALSRLGGNPLDQEVKNANFVRANELFFRKKYDQAITEYSNFLKKEPLNFKAQYNIAYCYEQQDKLDLAIEYYQKALKMNDASAEASQGLARVKAKYEEIQLTSLKRQIENDLFYERFSSAKTGIKQYLKLKPNDRWALDRDRVIETALESQKQAETPIQLSIKELEADTTTYQAQNQSITKDTTGSARMAMVPTEPEPTEEKSQVFIFIIAGLIIFSVAIIGLILTKLIIRKPSSDKEIKDTTVHSFLTDCYAKKRTGIVIVKSSIDSDHRLKGEIHIKDGNIADAKCGNVAGIDALHTLFETEIPESLSFQSAQIPSSGNIHQATLPLLMQWKVKKDKK